MRLVLCLLMAGMVLLTAGCSSGGSTQALSATAPTSTQRSDALADTTPDRAEPEPEAFAFKGVITMLVSFESDDDVTWLIKDFLSGDTLLPEELAEDFQRDGLLVSGEAVDVGSDESEFRPVQLLSIERSEPEPEPEPVSIFFKGIIAVTADGVWSIRDQLSDTIFLVPELEETYREEGLMVIGKGLLLEDTLTILSIERYEPQPEPEPPTVVAFQGVISTLVSTAEDESKTEPEIIWVIEDQLSGDALRPVNLAEEFMIDGLPVLGDFIELESDSDIYRLVKILKIQKDEPQSEPEPVIFSGEIVVYEQDNGNEWLIRVDGLGFLAPALLPEPFRRAGLAVEGTFIPREGGGDGSSKDNALPIELISITTGSDDDQPDRPMIIGILDQVQLENSEIWVFLTEGGKAVVVTSLPEGTEVEPGSTVAVDGFVQAYDEETSCSPVFIEIQKLEIIDPAN